jgi:hypothetical protein
MIKKQMENIVIFQLRKPKKKEKNLLILKTKKKSSDAGAHIKLGKLNKQNESPDFFQLPLKKTHFFLH